jgi:hypothetical protein
MTSDRSKAQGVEKGGQATLFRALRRFRKQMIFRAEYLYLDKGAAMKRRLRYGLPQLTPYTYV